MKNAVQRIIVHTQLPRHVADIIVEYLQSNYTLHNRITFKTVPQSISYAVVAYVSVSLTQAFIQSWIDAAHTIVWVMKYMSAWEEG